MATKSLVNVRYDVAKKTGIFRRICLDLLDRFLQSLPYKSALRADDGSLAYFPIYQGPLSWQPNNGDKMKANRYYVHSLHVRQMVARFRFVTTSY